jgi:hypothetical protein
MVVVPLMWVNQDRRVKWAEHAERAGQAERIGGRAGTQVGTAVQTMACASAIAELAERSSARPPNRSHVDAHLQAASESLLAIRIVPPH